mgnify:CR=1 FL=1
MSFHPNLQEPEAYDVHEFADDGAPLQRIQWHCGVKTLDPRYAQAPRYRGRKIIRRLEGDQTFSVQERAEQEAYIANPLAFWMRPDGDYLSDEPYQPVERFYDAGARETIEVEYGTQ